MGLDGVEILMKVEETFGVSIDDKEAATIRTPGDLFSVIMKQLGPHRSAICQTSRSFYRIRSFLSSSQGIKKSSIRPSTHTETFIPTVEKRRHWQALADQLNLGLPPLRRAKWLEITIRALAFTPIVCAIILRMLKSISEGHAWLLALLSIPLGILLHKSTARFAQSIPEECHTVGSLASAVLAINPKEFGNVRDWTQGDVWTTVQMIVVEQLGVPVEKVTKNAHFVDDLGLG